MRTFIKTINYGLADSLEVGNDSGTAPFGVKIIFDAYGTDDDDNVDKNSLSFTIYVHKDSLTKKFKAHEISQFAFSGVIHNRPKEECYIDCWYFKTEDEIHTDFEKGFIRAETIAYEDFIANEGWVNSKTNGKMRLEGKDYVV